MSLWRPKPMPTYINPPAAPKVPPPAPVYELARRSWPGESRLLYVRKKEDPWPYACHRDTALYESTMVGMLSLIFQSLEALGLEVVVSPAREKEITFRKKIEPPPIELTIQDQDNKSC